MAKKTGGERQTQKEHTNGLPRSSGRKAATKAATEIEVFHHDSRKIFADTDFFNRRILSDSWVLYHGTSSVHEAEIDREGLHPRRFQVSAAEMMEVVGVFKSMNWRWPLNLTLLTSWSYPTAADAQGDIRSLFLTADPVVAATYSGRKYAGGESTQMLLNCLKDLRRYLRDPEVRLNHLREQWEEREQNRTDGRSSPLVLVRRPWLKERLEHLRPLYDRLLCVQREHQYGVIYACRFYPEDLPRVMSGGCNTFVIRGEIGTDRIVAKALIRGNVREVARKRGLIPWASVKNGGLSGAVAKRDIASANTSPTNMDRDVWRQGEVDPAAGTDICCSMDSGELRNYLTKRFPGFLDPFEGGGA